MTETTPYALSKMLTQLLARNVTVALQLKASTPRPKLIYGVYQSVPQGETVVVKSDLTLMGALGGALVGLPSDTVGEQIKAGDLGEALKDGIHEVFNITSTPLSMNGRIVFQTMHTDQVLLKEAARMTVNSPALVTRFDVSLSGYTGGEFDILRAAVM